MQAQYSSRCPSCGERIEEGDDIFRDDELDAWVCEGCEPAPLRITKPKHAPKKGPSLADRLDDEGPTRGGIPVAGSSPAGSTSPMAAELFDVEHIERMVVWLGWFMGEGNIPTSMDVAVMQKLLPCLHPEHEPYRALFEHIEYARSIGVK